MTPAAIARLRAGTSRGAPRAQSRGTPSQLLQVLAVLRLLKDRASQPVQAVAHVGIMPRRPVAPAFTARDLAVGKYATQLDRARTDALTSQVGDIIGGTLKGALGAGLAGVASQGFAAGGEAALASLGASFSAMPAAAPIATLGIIGSIIVPAIVSGDMFSNHIDPVFDATTAEGQARARRQAVLIRDSLATTGTKFGFKGQADPDRFAL